MSQEDEERSTLQHRNELGQDVPPLKLKGIDLRAAYTALIKGYMTVQMKKYAQDNADDKLKPNDEVKN